MDTNLTRREFLRLLGLTAGSSALGIAAASCADSRSAATVSSQALTAEELDKVASIASRLFEPEDARERSELDSTIRWWAKGRTTAGPHLQLYRDGLARKANPEAVQALTDEILEGIYSTAPGWNSLGYSTWPGVPSRHLEYTTKPHAAARITG